MVCLTRANRERLHLMDPATGGIFLVRGGASCIMHSRFASNLLSFQANNCLRRTGCRFKGLKEGTASCFATFCAKMHAVALYRYIQQVYLHVSQHQLLGSWQPLYLECVENCCSGVNLPSELLQDVIHLVHHLLSDSTSGLDRLEALQQLKCRISTAQLPGTCKD